MPQWACTGRERGQGAHSGQGPVLAILPMLAPKWGLRVGPGGSALPLTCVALPGRRKGVRAGNAPTDDPSRGSNKELMLD